MDMTVTNIGVDPGFSALFSPNAAMHTGFTQVALAEDHKTSSFVYIGEVKKAVAKEIARVADVLLQRQPCGRCSEHGRPGTDRCSRHGK